MSPTAWTTDEAVKAVRSAFADKRIAIVEFSTRRYPEETIFVVSVAPADLEHAARVGNDLDSVLLAHGYNAFVTVRQMAPKAAGGDSSVTGVHDDRAIDLVRLLQARARTSEGQPALTYVPDSAASIASATAARHHLVFGRRGAGKTALLLEAKRQAEAQGDLAVWVNLQPFRWVDLGTTGASVVQRVLDAIEISFQDQPRSPQVLADAVNLNQTLSSRLAKAKTPDLNPLLPQIQRVLSRFTKSTGKRLYVFLDDFYFVPRSSQVELLDLLHAIVRDSDVWLKVATIRNLSRWFDPSTQTGLQVGHDADAIDLDVTLQDPARAKVFLENVLKQYAESAGVHTLGRVFSGASLDRLLLASGSVPRDYLVLASNSIAKARERSNARTVGVQDVNKSAGDAAVLKLQELDEDLSSNNEWAKSTRFALDRVVAYCLDETHWTYFRVDFRDKDKHGGYELLASLMDLRMIHLVNPSVSDESHAGEKAEVFMLDLSQYSGERLKKYLHVLDFVGGKFVLKETGRKGDDRVGDTAKKLISILRRGPKLDLTRLEMPAQTPAT